jgi:Chaperone of endosialidase
MTTPHLQKSIGRSPLRLAFFLVPLVLAWFALSPTGRAQDASETDGNQNTAMEGSGALSSLTTGLDNTALGFDALFDNTEGSDNTASGAGALAFNTTGGSNTASGHAALFSNTTGSSNTANGDSALSSNTTGFSNTASGFQALKGNTTGAFNTAIGQNSMQSNTTGGDNTAIGVNSLQFNASGASDVAIGEFTLTNNTSGNLNTATGVHALQNNTIGSNNTADGEGALANNTTGNTNTADGENALNFNTTGSSNVALGFNAGTNLTTGSNKIDIGNKGVAAESKTIRIGKVGTQTNTFIAAISGVTVAGGVGVIIDTKGHLGTVVSSERFKDGIKPMGKASEAILQLQPVTFHYKHELDPDSIPQFGLVAEHVEKVNPDLVARDDKGKPYSVRYEAVNAMLLNEFLKEHRRIEEQDRRIDKLTAQLKQQAALIQKVSNKVEMTRPAPQMVENGR